LRKQMFWKNIIKMFFMVFSMKAICLITDMTEPSVTFGLIWMKSKNTLFISNKMRRKTDTIIWGCVYIWAQKTSWEKTVKSILVKRFSLFPLPIAVGVVMLPRI